LNLTNTIYPQFLGGDEKHTHLVRGLDKSLADKVRRDEGLPEGGETLDDYLPSAPNPNKKSSKSDYETDKPVTGSSLAAYAR